VREAVLVRARQVEHRPQAVLRHPLRAVQAADVEVRVGRDGGEVADDHPAAVALVLDDVGRVIAHVAHDERAVGEVALHALLQRDRALGAVQRAAQALDRVQAGLGVTRLGGDPPGLAGGASDRAWHRAQCRC
jgi:hypothetical protein